MLPSIQLLLAVLENNYPKKPTEQGLTLAASFISPLLLFELHPRKDDLVLTNHSPVVLFSPCMWAMQTMRKRSWCTVL